MTRPLTSMAFNLGPQSMFCVSPGLSLIRNQVSEGWPYSGRQSFCSIYKGRVCGFLRQRPGWMDQRSDLLKWQQKISLLLITLDHINKQNAILIFSLPTPLMNGDFFLLLFKFIIQCFNGVGSMCLFKSLQVNSLFLGELFILLLLLLSSLEKSGDSSHS